MYHFSEVNIKECRSGNQW